MAVRRTVLINLLSVRAGGQITRARAFMSRIRQFDPESRVIVLQEASIRNLFDCVAHNIEVVKVRFMIRSAIALQRMVWENAVMPGLMVRMTVDTYITFSHYLPYRFPKNVYSIVAVSNLAPFSKAALSAESCAKNAKMFLQKKSILSSVERASTVVALSNTCKNILIKNGVDPGNISVIPNGVDQDSFTYVADSKIIRDNNIGRQYILYVSHFHRYKNHLRLIDAFSSLSEYDRSEFQLVLVGGVFNNRYFREVVSKIDSSGMTKEIAIIPGLYARDLSEIYSDATLFVFPSLIENCPNILLEAMSYGLPILSGSLDPMPEFCGEAAMYFNPLSVSDLKDKLKYCLANKEARDLLAAKARARSSIYSWDSFSEKITSIYLRYG